MAMKISYLIIFAAVAMLASACQPAAAPVAISNRPVSINDDITPMGHYTVSVSSTVGSRRR